MAWTVPSDHVYATGEVVTAATLNTYVKDNLIDLDRRTTQTAATVATAQTTTSDTYTDLATAGPAVTVTIGSTGKCEVIVYASLVNDTADESAAMSFAVSGASTVAAADAFALAYTVAAGGSGARMGATFHLSGLTSGSNTFTAKYRRAGGAGTATFADRKIAATPLGS